MDTARWTAAVFRPGQDHADIKPVEFSGLRDDEVLVRLVATGICHTDLSYKKRITEPTILGHEGAGVVERVGPGVQDLAAGDHVVLSYLYCGACPSCEADQPSYCSRQAQLNFSGLRLDGTSALSVDGAPVRGHFCGQSSFATHSVANRKNVVKVDASAPLELLGPLGCSVQTGAGAVINVLKAKAGEALAVFGGGGVGLSAVMAAAVQGCSPIVVVEPLEARRRLALEVGATHVLDPNEGDVVGKIQEIAPGGLLHAIDTCGIPAVVQQALASLGQRGQLVLLTANAREAALETPIYGLIARGISVHGVVWGESLAQSFIPKLVELVASGRFPLEKLVRFYPLEDIDQAMADTESGLTVKPIVRMAPA